MNFAIVWFDTLTTASTGNAPGSSMFGLVRGGDWVLPTGEGANRTFGTGTGATVYDQITLGNNGAAATAPAGASVAISSNTGSSGLLTVVPEPSSALLGAVGALALLRRRRI